ncbi:hypothetical protein J6590_026911 [Homalodisca vitripennis]|nr:hypothetical protein J6590_026911 [Homalodisca vitripennis]
MFPTIKQRLHEPLHPSPDVIPITGEDDGPLTPRRSVRPGVGWRNNAERNITLTWRPSVTFRTLRKDDLSRDYRTRTRPSVSVSSAAFGHVQKSQSTAKPVVPTPPRDCCTVISYFRAPR